MKLSLMSPFGKWCMTMTSFFVFGVMLSENSFWSITYVPATRVTLWRYKSSLGKEPLAQNSTLHCTNPKHNTEDSKIRCVKYDTKHSKNLIVVKNYLAILYNFWNRVTFSKKPMQHCQVYKINNTVNFSLIMFN